MKCYKCGKGIFDGVSMVPIDPKGKGRRWVCLDCEPSATMPQDVRDLCGCIDPKFKANEN